MGLTALAAALRFLLLRDIPPGLYHDEAFNGLDALRVLAGERPIYFAANRGREPFFIYLVAATVGWLGRTPGALRLAAAICGTLTVPATYLMARPWFNKRVALLSAAILATTYWHVQLSRVGFRAITLPLAIALMVWASGRAFYSRRRRTWLLAGVLYGASFYTYVAARFTPIVLLGFAAYLLLAGERDRLWPGTLYFGAGALGALLPLGLHALDNWSVVMGRPSQVWVFSAPTNEGNPLIILGRQLLSTLGMFFVRGDTIPRHNLPGRPVFDALMAGAMILGTALAIARARRRDTGSVLALLWVGLMLGPTWLAEDAPHFLRAVGVLPLLTVLPALGLEAIWDAPRSQELRAWGSVLVCVVLGFSLGSTARDYFVRYGPSPQVAYAFEAAATELAVEINRFTGIGWDGNGIAASSGRVDSQGQVHLDERLCQAWEGISFLVPEQETLIKLPPHTTPSLPAKGEILLLLWPHDDLEPYLAALPRLARIEAHAGPLTRGDLEENAYPAYVAYSVKPLRGPRLSPIARFGESIDLVDYEVERNGPIWRVHLIWRAQATVDEDYTAFVYLCDTECQGDQLVAQDDAQPGDGYYPTHLWRPGDVVVDVHFLEVASAELARPRLGVGLYSWPAIERLPVIRPSGQSAGDMLILSLGCGTNDSD